MSEYLEISRKLSKFYNFDKDSFAQSNDILMALLLKRKRIIHKAQQKEVIFESILKERYKEMGNLNILWFMFQKAIGRILMQMF